MTTTTAAGSTTTQVPSATTTTTAPEAGTPPPSRDAMVDLDVAAWRAILDGLDALIADLHVTARSTPCFRTTNAEFLCIE